MGRFPQPMSFDEAEAILSDYLRELVHEGALFMDEIQPGWEHRVSLKVFSLECADRCVLGQTYFDYYTALDQLQLAEIEAVIHGFAMPSSEDFKEMDAPVEVQQAYSAIYSTQYGWVSREEMWNEAERHWRDEILQRRHAEEIADAQPELPLAQVQVQVQVQTETRELVPA